MVCDTVSIWMQRICRKKKGGCDSLKIFFGVDFPTVLFLLNFSTSFLPLIKIINYWALNFQVVRPSTFNWDEEIVLCLWIFCYGENIPHFSINSQTAYIKKLIWVLLPLSLTCLFFGGCNQRLPGCFALLDAQRDLILGNVNIAISAWWSVWWLDRDG